jgi:putative phosphoesterase
MCKMKLGVLSDTHQNLEDLRLAIDHLLGKEVDCFVHLGDDYQDAETFDEFDIRPVIKVPGVYDPEYPDRTTPHRLLQNLGGFRVMFSHTPESHSHDFPEDLRPEDCVANGEIDILLHGHTHVPSIEITNSILRFNPGHLRKRDKKGHPPTFGLLEIEKGEARAQLLDFASGEIIASTDFTKP